MTLVSNRQPPLGEHRAMVREYLRGLDLPFESVAGAIVRERLATLGEEDLLRPGLVLWACDACGGDLRDALPVAASFYLFDRFMRMHDELVEDHEIARWGLGQTLNAGDALYALAFRTLAHDVIDARHRLEAATLVTRAVLEAIEGRNVDLERQDGDGLLSQVRSVNRRVASLMGAALAVGALIAGADERTVRGFMRAGRLLAGAATIDEPELAKRVGGKCAGAMSRSLSDETRRKEFADVISSFAT